MTSSPGSSPSTADPAVAESPVGRRVVVRVLSIGLAAGGWVVLAVAGFLVAVVGLFVSRSSVDVFGVGVPYGMVLVLACLAAVLEAGRVLYGFPGAAIAGGSWVVGFIVALWPRPAGDVLVAEDGYGIGYCLLGLLAVVGLAYRAKAVGPRPRDG